MFDPKQKEFHAREARSFCDRLGKAAFIGDWAKRVRASLARQLAAPGPTVYLEPLTTLGEFLRPAQPEDSIGGAPQLIRVTQHMNTRPLCVKWGDEDTLFGRPLFDYENTDYWAVEPFTRQISHGQKVRPSHPPRKGRRH